MLISEKMTLDIPETIPVKLSICYVYKYNYDYYDYYVDEDYYYEEYCDRYVYARNCNGKIQFDLSYYKYYNYHQMCFGKLFFYI